MGMRNTALLSIAVIAILLMVQLSVIAEADRDDDGSKLEMKVHYLYKTSPAKPDKPDKPGGGKPGGDEGSYETFGRGIVWKDTPIDIVIDADNSGLTTAFVSDAIWAGATEWDSHTSTGLFGSYTISTTATWDDTAPDGENEMVFEDYDNSNVIAVCIIWGYFGGPPGMREIIEFDILFNTDFTWGNADTDGDGTSDDDSVMDVQNIACHEIGHGLGLADLYDSGDSEETMYGYASYGEILKRDLYNGDIAGIQSLYGK
jgi:hypothetical protein